MRCVWGVGVNVIYRKSSTHKILNSLATTFFLFFPENLSKKFGTQINELWDNFGSDFTYPGNLPAYVEEYFEDQEKNQNDLPPGRIQCLPAPGTLMFFRTKYTIVVLNCFDIILNSLPHISSLAIGH